MTAMIFFFLLGSVAATLADRRGPSSFYSDLRLSALGSDGTTVRVHSLFCELFDYVYGQCTWSLRRVGASIISTTVGLIVVVIAMGPDTTVFAGIRAANELRNADSAAGNIATVTVLLAVLSLLGPLNFVADFFSLAETRFVLRLGKNRGLGWICALTALDLLLTSAIFMVPVLGAGYYFGDIAGTGVAVSIVLARAVGLPFLLTTFVTSFAWLLFVSSAIAIRVLSWWSLTRRFLDEIQQSERPTVGFASLGYAVFALLYWAVAIVAGFFVAPYLPESRNGEPVAILVGETYRAVLMDSTTPLRVGFEGEADVVYVIEAKGAPVLDDIALELRADGVTLNYARSDGFWAGLVYKVESDGTYIVEIARGPGAFGLRADFNVAIREATGAAVIPGDVATAMGAAAGDDSPELRKWVGRNGRTPGEILGRLVEDPDVDVRLAVARHGNTFAADLERLAGDSAAEVREVVARRPNTFPAVLERLAGDSAAEVREAVARRPNTFPAVLERLAGDSAAEVREAVARHANTFPAVLERLAGDARMEVRVAVAGNFNAFGALALERLAGDARVEVRVAVARNGSASEAVLERLAGDRSGTVREAVAWNANTAVAVRERLAGDGVAEVRRAAGGGMLSRIDVLGGGIDLWAWGEMRQQPGRASVSTEVLEELAGDLSVGVRQAVAQNSNTLPSVLGQLTGDSSVEVRVAVAQNPNTLTVDLGRLAGDSRAEVREAVARNGNTLAVALERLAGDPRVNIREAVAARPRVPGTVLQQLAEDPSVNVRLEVARNGNTLAVTLEQLAEDPRGGVRRAVASNRNTSAVVLGQLAEDPRGVVRRAITR